MGSNPAEVPFCFFFVVWGAANWAFLAVAFGMKSMRPPGTCQEPHFDNSRLDDTRQRSLGRAQAPSALNFLLISADGTVSVQGGSETVKDFAYVSPPRPHARARVSAMARRAEDTKI